MMAKIVNEMHTLLAQEEKFFAENGFVGPFKVYEPDEARELLKTIRVKNLNRSKALYNNDVNYDRHFDISELSQHIGRPEIVRRLQRLIGSDIICWRTEFFPKFPGSKGTEWHQVETYKYTTGTSQLMATVRRENTPMELTVWTAFTESTKENGCLKFMPGSHKRWYFDESKTPQKGRNNTYNPVISETSFYGYNFADFKIDPNWEPDESQSVALEMNAGECVIFTARCMHGSFPNTSKRSTRFAINARYVPADVRVYPDQNDFTEHGGFFDLSNYGCVLVSGVDRYKHNRLRTENNLGEPFPDPLVPPTTVVS
jgi:non-heme Fe2+,alpha-ketoglutarate-dependent halogenase